MTVDRAAVWRADRAAAAKVHQDALDHARNSEAEQASELLKDFVKRARAQGIAAVRLHALPYSGAGRYKSNVIGWYLRRDGSIAVDQSGHYYIMKVPRSFGAHFRSVSIPPSQPSLTIGKGGRDGDTIELKTLLELRLAQPSSFPTA